MIHIFRILLTIAVSLIFFLSDICPSYAAQAMVVTNNAGVVTINKGSRDGLRAGQELYVVRSGKKIGTIRITKAEEYYCEATAVSSEMGTVIAPGDMASADSPAAQSPETAAKDTGRSGGDVSRESIEVYQLTDEKEQKKKEEEKKKQQEETEKSYLSTLGTYTKISTFSKGGKGRVNVSIGDALMAISALGHTTSIPYRDNWMLFNIGSRTLHNYTTSKAAAGPTSKVTIGVIYYGEELIRQQAKFFASKENVEDPEQVKAIEDGIRQQLGSDTYTVFQVKLSNTGKTVVQLSPFKWKMYLITNNGQKIRSSRYDEALDRGIGPGQEVQGYMYFPKTDDIGQPITGPMKISLENIIEGKAQLSWQ